LEAVFNGATVGHVAAELNLDLLEWFSEAEREDCPACGERAVVGADGAPLFRVCLGCAAVWVGGERLDNRLRAIAATTH
jgi:hypothetical protein